MKKKLKECRGEFAINGALIFLLVMLLLVLAISVLGVATQSNKVHAVAGELVRYMEVRGLVSEEVYAPELARLESVSGIDVTCRVAADLMPGTTKVQFGGAITVTLSYTAKFGVGGVVSVPVAMHSTVTGRSEQYWK